MHSFFCKLRQYHTFYYYKTKKTLKLLERFFTYEKVELLLNLIHDSFESCGIVHCEVGKNLTVNLDTCFVKSTHQL